VNPRNAAGEVVRRIENTAAFMSVTAVAVSSNPRRSGPALPLTFSARLDCCNMPQACASRQPVTEHPPTIRSRTTCPPIANGMCQQINNDAVVVARVEGERHRAASAILSHDGPVSVAVEGRDLTATRLSIAAIWRQKE